MAASRFYDTTKAEQVAINLFYGWGYNFYRAENQLRADDLLIRAKVDGMVGAARRAVADAEGSYRRKHIPAPTRDKPFPEQEAIRIAAGLEEIGRSIDRLQGQIRSAPVPETDRIWQRHRNEAATLVRLLQVDQQLVSRAEGLRQAICEMDGPQLMAHLPELQNALTGLEQVMEERRLVLGG